MPHFPFSKVDHYRNTQYLVDDIIDIKFPSELENGKKDGISLFIVDDDPLLLQILNTHFSKVQLHSPTGKELGFNIKNFATGRSLLVNLNLKPDIILLNKLIGKGLPNALSGNEILEQIEELYPEQEVIILNDLKIDIRNAFIENGLRDYLTQDDKALNGLNNQIMEILSSGLEASFQLRQKFDVH